MFCFFVVVLFGDVELVFLIICSLFFVFNVCVLVPMAMNLQAPSDTGVLVNGMLSLSCSVDSQGGAANITWSATTLDGSEISLPEALSVVNDFVTVSSISIDNINQSYAGNYSCIATNRASKVSQSFIVSVISECVCVNNRGRGGYTVGDKKKFRSVVWP